MNRAQRKEVVATLLKADRRDLAEQFVGAAAVYVADDLAMYSRYNDQGTEFFKFTGKTQRGGVAMFTVMISPSGLLSTKNTKGIPSGQHVHLATNWARKQVRGAP